MGNFKEVKKILDECVDDFYKEMNPIDDIARQICQLFDAECQERVERIFREIEEVAVTAPFHDEQPPTMYWQMSTTEWQALKKRERVE